MKNNKKIKIFLTFFAIISLALSPFSDLKSFRQVENSDILLHYSNNQSKLTVAPSTPLSINRPVFSFSASCSADPSMIESHNMFQLLNLNQYCLDLKFSQPIYHSKLLVINSQINTKVVADKLFNPHLSLENSQTIDPIIESNYTAVIAESNDFQIVFVNNYKITKPVRFRYDEGSISFFAVNMPLRC